MSAERAVPKRRALGRGLGALIPQGTDDSSTGAAARQRSYFVVAIEEIHPNPDQPRKQFDEARLEELAASIRSEGVIQPLIVRERGQGGFELIAGERRWRAAQRAGVHEVPVVVRDVSPTRAFEMALVENIQRADLNPIEEAEAYRHLLDTAGLTHEKLAERVGKDRATVTNTLRLLQLPASVREMVLEGRLTMGHARALLGLEDPAALEQTARKVAARLLSVRATEALVRAARQGAKPSTSSPGAAKTPVVRDLEARLGKALGARVQVLDKGGNKGGKLEISYSDLDELDRLLELLLRAPHS